MRWPAGTLVEPWLRSPAQVCQAGAAYHPTGWCSG